MVNVFFIIFSVVCVIFRIWLMLVIKVKFFSGILILFNVVSKIIKEIFGILVIFFEVIIKVSIRIIFCLIDSLML